MTRKILWGSAVLLVVLATAAFGYYQAMVNGWIRYNEYDIRTEGQLKVGDLVPDLTLAQAAGDGKVLLSDLYRERPVILAFGSYT